MEDAEPKTPSSRTTSDNVSDAEPPYPVGATIDGKYVVVRSIGEGGAGTVYEVVHTGLSKHFALKLLRRHGEAALPRFQREAEALGRLSHDHIVVATDCGIDAATERPYLVMERLEGETLATRIRKDGRWSVDRALPVLEELASEERPRRPRVRSRVFTFRAFSGILSSTWPARFGSNIVVRSGT